MAAGLQQARAQDLVERGLLDVGLEARGRLQRARVLLEAEDRGDGEQLVGGVAEPREPDADGVAHALGHLRRPGLGQPAQHLLDEEGVAAGAGVDAGGDLVVAEQRARERGDVVLARGRAARCGRARRRAGGRRARR